MPWWIWEGLRRVGLFLLAVLVMFVVFLMILLPALVAVWWLLRYAARQ